MADFETEFDAGGYLKEMGMNVLGAGEQDGEVRVRGADGVEGIVNLKAALADQGIKNAQININSPDTALEKSPVGLLDRFKLSFGNAKGQVEYLKKNYQDARIGADGELIVKDKGVWHKVDGNVFGNGDGWDLAEAVKDVADMGGESLVIGGSLVGGAAGAAAGAVAGPVASAAAAAGLAGLGGGSGSAVKMAMGRILGTFNATPDEVAKDLAVDTLMSTLGEGVALGAKHLIVPALKNTFVKAANSPAIHNAVAQTVKAVTGAPLDDALYLVKNAAEVNPAINATIAKATKMAKAEGTSATSDYVIKAARQNTMEKVKLITEGAQKNLSKKFVNDYAAVVGEVAVDFDDGGEFVKALTETLGTLEADGFVTRATKGAKKGRFIPGDDNTIQRTLGIVDGVAATNFKTNAARLANTLERLNLPFDPKFTGRAEVVAPKGKELATEIFESIRAMRELQRNIPDTHAASRQKIGELASGFSTRVRAKLPANVQELAKSADGNYARNLQYVDRAEQALRMGDQGIEALINERRGGQNAIQHMFDALSNLHPAGPAVKKELSKALAVETFYNLVPRGAVGSSTARLGAVGAATALAGAPGGAAAAYAMSPRQTARQFAAAANVNRTVKNLSQSALAELATSKESYEAIMGELFRNLGREELK